MFRQRLKSKSSMNEPTLLQLQCFEALVAEGSFAAAAARLNRTHLTVHAAVTALEVQVGMVLLDRAGYRVSLTAEGAAFRARVAVFLHQYEHLQRETA
jgi:DNA-binding transcriptional LysR family regulator